MKRASLLLMFLMSGCSCNPFAREAPPPPPPGPVAATSTTPPVPAVPSPAIDPPADTGAFDIRLVRVQPGQHLSSEQLCDVSFSGRLAAVEGRDARRYGVPAANRMSIKCRAVSGEGWADLIFEQTTASHALEVVRDKRIRVRILSADGGFADYPIVQFVETVGDAPPAPRSTSLFSNVDPGFDFRQVQLDEELVGSTQRCGVAFAGSIDIIDAPDRSRRQYPAEAQNRMVLKCKHAQGEEWVDLIFTAAQAMSALAVERGDRVQVRILNRDGGFADYPVVAFVGEDNSG